MAGSAAIASAGDPAGRWSVIERGLGLDCPLHRLEVRPAKGPRGEPVVLAFERNEGGQERSWGSARLVPVGSDGAARAEWTARDETVTLILRSESKGRLSALVRRRDRDRPWAVAERVRQVVLEREPDDRLVVEGTDRPAPPRRGPTSSGSKSETVALYAIGADGTNFRALALPEDFVRAGYPAWSPDGKRLAFTAFDATGRDPLIRVVDASGGPTVAVAAGVAPCWSRDGSRLAYMASGKPDYATDWNAPGRNDERIEAIRLTGPGAGDVETLARGIWPRWSPADDRLAFVARREANWDVYTRSADGLGLVRLTDDPATDTYPIWSADGRDLVFLSDRGNRWDLYRVPADGRGQVARLTNHRRREDQPSLSPDGSRVAFTDGLGRPDSRVLLLDLASGAVRPLIDPPQGERDPAFSPDGRTVAFVSRRPSPLLPLPGRRP